MLPAVTTLRTRICTRTSTSTQVRTSRRVDTPRCMWDILEGMVPRWKKKIEPREPSQKREGERDSTAKTDSCQWALHRHAKTSTFDWSYSTNHTTSQLASTMKRSDRLISLSTSSFTLPDFDVHSSASRMPVTVSLRAISVMNIQNPACKHPVQVCKAFRRPLGNAIQMLACVLA